MTRKYATSNHDKDLIEFSIFQIFALMTFSIKVKGK